MSVKKERINEYWIFRIADNCVDRVEADRCYQYCVALGALPHYLIGVSCTHCTHCSVCGWSYEGEKLNKTFIAQVDLTTRCSLDVEYIKNRLAEQIAKQIMPHLKMIISFDPEGGEYIRCRTRLDITGVE